MFADCASTCPTEKKRDPQILTIQQKAGVKYFSLEIYQLWYIDDQNYETMIFSLKDLDLFRISRQVSHVALETQSSR